MDRQITHTGALIPNATLLGGEKAKLIALGHALDAILGGSTSVGGLSCNPTSPASLSVVIGPGSIMTKTAVDSTAFGDLGTDSTAVVKQGILAQALTLPALTPPNASGYSQVFLVQAAQADQDSGTVLPYYNAANPAQPFNGPNNSGASDVTLRTSACVVAIKPGVAATSGTQTAPSPDPGYTGLYTITLTNGQTQITSVNIAVYPGAPFIPVKLPAVPARVQDGQWIYGPDTGAAGSLAATLNPVPASLPDGMEIRVKAANPAAGADTFAANGLGALPIVRRGGAATKAKDWSANDILTLRKLGSVWQLGGLVRSDILDLVTGSGQVVQIVQGPVLYVRTDGSDTGSTNDGSSNDATHAFATIAAAIAYGLARYNLAGQTLTIQLGAAGTYAFPGTIPAGAGKILIQGSASNIGGYILSGSGPAGGGQACMVVDGARVAINGLTAQNTGQNNHTVSAIGGGACTVTNCLLAMPAGSAAYSQLFAGASGSISIGAGVSTSGNAAAFANATGGSVTIAGVTVTVLGNPFYAFAFAVAQGVGSLGLLPGATFSGSATGARFYVGRVGYIQTSGAGGNVFPGSSAGTVDSATFGVLN